MIIKKMTAHFGVLNGETLELEPGLNIIEAPNESGKTTWCAFLCAMLYGLGTARRGGHGDIPDRERYAPWDGAPMSGRVELSHRGDEITLRRFSPEPGAPLRGFSAEYTGTAVPVSALSAADAGEQLTGLSANVFKRTAFIGPAGLAVTETPELEKKIASIVSAGEECSYTEAAERLRALQRRCRYHGQGRLPELEQEIDALCTSLDRRKALNTQLETLAEREDTVKTRQAQLMKHREELPTDPMQTAIRSDWKETERLSLRREREAAALRTSLLAGVLHGAAPDENALTAAETDTRRAQTLQRAVRHAPKGNYGAFIAALLCAVAFAVCGLLRQPIWFVPACACATVCAALWFRTRSQRLQWERAKKELGRLLKKYSVQRPEEIRRSVEDYKSRWEEMLALSAAAEELSVQAQEMAGNKTQTRTSSPEADRDFEEVERELTELARQRNELAEEKGRLFGALEALGDPEREKERLESARQEHEALKRKHGAITLALQELAAADEEQRTRFSPALAKKTEEIFRLLTGRADTELTLGRDLAATLRGEGDVDEHSQAWFSRGTRDQLYLSVRLALCELLPAGEEPCPIILDDALLAFDDERMGLAVKYLAELSRKRQIILFTCQKRERKFLKKIQ